VWNKTDIAGSHDIGDGLAVSAKTGTGLPALRAAIAALV
jgi:hypothetical protein